MYIAHDRELAQFLHVVLFGFSRYDSPPHPVAYAEALHLLGKRLQEQEDIRSLAVANSVRALVGAGHALALSADENAALALRAHGYLDTAEAVVESALQAAGERPRGSPSEILSSVAPLINTYAAISRHRLPSVDDGQRHQRARQRLNLLLDRLDALGSDLTPELANWVTTIYRRHVQLDIAELKLFRMEGARRLRVPVSASGHITEAERAARTTLSPSWRFSWWLQQMQLAIELRDRDRYAEMEQLAGEEAETMAWFANLLKDLRGLQRKATLLGWTELDEKPYADTVLRGQPFQGQRLSTV
jgi:hypothetical protein